MVVSTEPGAPKRLESNERLRLRSAAYLAQRRYPGPVGELVFTELIAWEEFGFRFGGGKLNLIKRLVDELMKPQLTKE